MQSAFELYVSVPYSEITLDAVAERAGVSKQTVIRQFGSKDGLVLATARRQAPREEAARTGPPGDVAATVRLLADRYEFNGDANVRVAMIEEQVPVLKEVGDIARASHRAWLARVFAAHVPSKRRPAARRRAIMALYAATDVMVWKLLRRDFELSRSDTHAVMAMLVDGVVRTLQAEAKGTA